MTFDLVSCCLWPTFQVHVTFDLRWCWLPFKSTNALAGQRSFERWLAYLGEFWEEAVKKMNMTVTLVCSLFSKWPWPWFTRAAGQGPFERWLAYWWVSYFGSLRLLRDKVNMFWEGLTYFGVDFFSKVTCPGGSEVFWKMVSLHRWVLGGGCAKMKWPWHGLFMFYQVTLTVVQ